MAGKRQSPQVPTILEVSDVELAELRAGVRLRSKELENARTYLESRDLDTTSIDSRLDIVRGAGPARPGLFGLLGFRDGAPPVDPNQTDLEDDLEKKRKEAAEG